MPMSFRILFGVPFAAVIAIALFLAMRGLIAFGAIPVDDKPDIPKLDIFQNVTEMTAKTVRHHPEATPVDPPPAPPLTEPTDANIPDTPFAEHTGYIPPMDGPNIGEMTPVNYIPDQNAQPIIRIEPDYPLPALTRGLEGTCDLRFDVSAQGSPYNIDVMNCSSPVFERNSRRAVEDWKYRPKTLQGQAVPMHGVETRLRYQMEG